MTAFHTIAIPDDDILQGRLTMDVFAADYHDLDEVVFPTRVGMNLSFGEDLPTPPIH